MKRKIIIAALVVLLATGITLLWLFRFHIRFNYPSEKEFPVRGIDISHHNGVIDWQKLRAENFSFVFMKATEGGDYTDPSFSASCAEAQENNFIVGAYHFYSFCRNGNEQAAHFIEVVPHLPGKLPPVLDLEYSGNCKTAKPKTQIIQEIGDCIDSLKNYYGVAPVLYCTSDFYTDYSLSRFSSCPVWIRNVYSRPEELNGRKWTFWQFASNAHAEGISERVDLDVFNGDTAAFRKFTETNAR
ncbi:MAG TPA: GH25 family lysozyme [Bacteroidia bacterium]|nr:GH25 family lysozyme [Bacteroidia bacterium]